MNMRGVRSVRRLWILSGCLPVDGRVIRCSELRRRVQLAFLRPNIVSMIKPGATRLPPERLGAMARVLDVGQHKGGVGVHKAANS